MDIILHGWILGLEALTWTRLSDWLHIAYNFDLDLNSNLFFFAVWAPSKALTQWFPNLSSILPAGQGITVHSSSSAHELPGPAGGTRGAVWEPLALTDSLAPVAGAERILISSALSLSQAVLIADSGHEVLEACNPGASFLPCAGHYVQRLHVGSVVNCEAAVWVKVVVRVALEDLRLLALTNFADRVYAY